MTLDIPISSDNNAVVRETTWPTWKGSLGSRFKGPRNVIVASIGFGQCLSNSSGSSLKNLTG
jgi:hypothetical protein